jgi:alkyl sulfatase BDS1-like metallo-beta-lactamase superfamily hydrolase
VHEEGIENPEADALVSLPLTELVATLFGGRTLAACLEGGAAKVTGRGELYEALADMIEPLTANFPIVTP